MPVSDADRLFLMANRYPRAGIVGNASAPSDYHDWLRGVTAFDEQAMFNTVSTTMVIGGMPHQVEAMTATPSLLRMLKVSPVLGRIFDEEEGTTGHDQKVILSDAPWQELFNRSPGLIGHVLRLNGRPFAIIGVLPADFLFISPDVRVWTPLAFMDQQKSMRPGGNAWYHVGHLRPGATLEQVRSQVKAIELANFDRFPQWKQALADPRLACRYHRKEVSAGSLLWPASIGIFRDCAFPLAFVAHSDDSSPDTLTDRRS
jgi:putative ABC transport system permease protein